MSAPALDPIAAQWRAYLEEVVEPHKDTPLLMSGGVDSLTLLFACVELGGKPPCYTYRLGDIISEDMRVSRRACDELGVPHVEVVIPYTQEQLVADVKEILTMLHHGGCRKTLVQCAQPIMHLCRKIAADGGTAAIVGTGAVVLDGREVHTLWHTKGEEAAREYRTHKMKDQWNVGCGTWAMHEMGKLCGTPLVEPLSLNPLRDYGLSLGMAEHHTPRQKGVALRAYPEHYRKGWWRPNSSMQVNGGIRTWHEDLLTDPSMNVGDHKRVGAIYNRIHKELSHAVAG